MNTTYEEFLARKTQGAEQIGRQVTADDVHDYLHDWQREIVVWAVGVGRCAIWADTGLGKTLMQLEWARLSGATSLIVAPLAVCEQTVREAAKIGIEARYSRDGIHGSGVWVTNYEMVQHFHPETLDAVVLDEASILKNADGKTRAMLTDHFQTVRHRLACTATPAPNDTEELTGQAAFLGVSTRANMLAAYFVHDADGWRLKGHARGPMFRWMSSWAIAIRKPSDMGYLDDGYDLPPLSVIPHMLDVDVTPDDQLFATDLGGVGGRAMVRRQTLSARCAKAAQLVAAEPNEAWLMWCGLNDEADELARLLPDSVNVHGGWPPEAKAQAMLDFADGKITRLICKPSIAAFGLNWQHCARMAFVGLSDSYEAYYQAIRRCYRYGQTRQVDAHVILSNLESQIAVNIARKERDADAVTAALVNEMRTSRSTA